MNPDNMHKIAGAIKAGQVGVMPTDTIYGIVGRADRPAVIDRIYQVKGRDYSKPFIVLISNLEELSKLKISLSRDQEQTLKQLWPAPISIILPCPDNSMEYLHRGLRSVAVRLPEPDWLRQLLKLTGPLVATSANKSNFLSSADLQVIKNQLPSLDFYIEGPVGAVPSKLARLNVDGQLEWLKRN